MESKSLPSAEVLLASAVQYLIQGEQHDAALLLLFCNVEYSDNMQPHYHREEDWLEPPSVSDIELNLTGPRLVYDTLERDGWLEDGAMAEQREVIYQAFCAVSPHEWEFGRFRVRAQLVDNLDASWRSELTEIAHGRGVHNQGVEIPGRSVVTWKGNIKFRSETERRIAIALDATGVLFLPNCLARLSAGDSRVTKESDFLVCRDGKWGILEVDGPFHPRAALDHSRDRLFQAYKIRVIHRFDWQACLDDAPGVVREFLTLLDKNG